MVLYKLKDVGPRTEIFPPSYTLKYYNLDDACCRADTRQQKTKTQRLCRTMANSERRGHKELIYLGVAEEDMIVSTPGWYEEHNLFRRPACDN